MATPASPTGVDQMSSERARSTIARGVSRALLGLLFILAMLTPWGESLDSTLTLHMVVQHAFYLAGGFLIASGVDLLILGSSKFSRAVTSTYSKLMKANVRLNRRGLVSFAFAALLAVYWHFPANFDAAVLSENVHIMMHITFTGIGGMLFVGSGLLTGRMRHVLLLLPGKAMGIFGAFLLFTTWYVYPVYPVGEQSETGLIMVVMMLVMDLTIVPYWLYKYFGKTPADMQVVSS